MCSVRRVKFGPGNTSKCRNDQRLRTVFVCRLFSAPAMLLSNQTGRDDMGTVLVLNQNYEPLNVCNPMRAFVLVDRGKAEVLEHGLGSWRSASRTYPLPSVIRLIYLIKRPRPQMRLSRREVFNRDRYTCQYCGHHGQRDLTLDHVLPRHRGGRHTWDNLVTACKACKHR